MIKKSRRPPLQKPEEGKMAMAKYADTMIGSQNLQKTAEFYKSFLGMEISNPGDGKSFMILKDPKTNQTLCIVGDPSILNAQPSIESENIDTTIENLKLLGGKVLSQETYATMKVANVEDVDGRKMCVWQNL
jgi:predicted enzyme related to lactoylglutathione lyase